MAYLKPRMSTVGAIAVAVAGLASIPAAHADAQYKSDRAYCMSGSASESRNLCLQEAAAAQTERQRGSHSMAKTHKPRASRADTANMPEKSASSP